LSVPSWSSVYPYYLSLPMHPDGDFYSCAVRLSMSLHHAASFNKTGYRRAGNKVSANGWAMVAEQLYQWLRRHELGSAEQIPVSPADRSRIPTQNGIIYLRNCFVRTTDRSPAFRSGDHLDLFVSGRGILSALRWPVEFPDGPFGLVVGCRDQRIRFWPTA
jgi:hypothetical protein